MNSASLVSTNPFGAGDGGTRSAQLTIASRSPTRAGFEHFRFQQIYNVRIPRAQQILNVDRKVHTAEHLASAMFYLGYRYMPYRRVGVGPALAGGIVAAILWEIAKQLFRLYIRQVGVYDQIYGPFAALVAFIMFVYYSAVVFVVGAAYVAALDARRR